MKDIIAAKEIGIRALNEASLGRVYQHYLKSKDKNKGGFAILTSWRVGNSPAQNKADLRALKGAIRAAGLGFSKMKGHWREKGQPEATPEPSLFVSGISFKLAHKLGNKYDQDAVIYGGPETNDKVVLIHKSGSTQNIGKFHPQKIAQAYSSIKGKTFIFEGFEYIAQSFMETLIAAQRATTVI
jgi:hypothetical protein